jgi:hypothetical protein
LARFFKELEDRFKDVAYNVPAGEWEGLQGMKSQVEAAKSLKRWLEVFVDTGKLAVFESKEDKSSNEQKI